MGLGIVWMYDGPGGKDPFTEPIDQTGVLTHGHLPENDNHGGATTNLADPRRAGAGPLTGTIPIASRRARSRSSSARSLRHSTSA